MLKCNPLHQYNYFSYFHFLFNAQIASTRTLYASFESIVKQIVYYATLFNGDRMFNLNLNNFIVEIQWLAHYMQNRKAWLLHQSKLHRMFNVTLTYERLFVKEIKLLLIFLGSLCNQCAFMCEQIAYLFSSEVTMPFQIM